MSEAYAKHERNRRRTDLLCLLQSDPDKRCMDTMLRTRLELEYGYRLTHVDLRGDLSWLEQQQLIEIHRYQDGQVWIAELRVAGEDVACRRAALPGGAIEAKP